MEPAVASGRPRKGLLGPEGARTNESSARNACVQMTCRKHIRFELRGDFWKLSRKVEKSRGGPKAKVEKSLALAYPVLAGEERECLRAVLRRAA